MKKVIIIGAGISGLTAGVYALQSGFDVTIYESHTIPGGASTSWRRKGYYFEGGIHWMTGTLPDTPTNKVWKNIGALSDDIPIHVRDPFLTYDFDSLTICLYRDIDKLHKHLLSIAPEDKKEIERLFRDVKKMSKISMPIMDIKGVKVREKSGVPLSSIIKMLPAFALIPFYSKQDSGEFSKRFRDPMLSQFIKTIIGPENNALGMVLTIATLASGDGGYPEGGSLAMARRIADKFEALGGTINFGSPVSKVVTRDGKAVGVLQGENEIPADAVIVTQDTLAAIDTLFETPINEPWAEKMRKETKPVLNTFVSIGVEEELSDLPESLYFNPKVPFYCGGQEQTIVNINNYAKFKDYAPDGCTAITSIIGGDTYEFWKQCKQNGTYNEEKERLANALIEIIENKWPRIKGKIAVWDVATPLTYERYLSSYKGSWMSVMGKGSKMESYPTKPKSINNLYFAGQRLMVPGGLPVAAETGRKAVQYLCRDTDTVFQGKM
ncbi:MAG: Hydroxyneurosporene desaturase [Firmicutes bacterium ADurb.Bin193]|nr:MAG: Hydroxyneurosporene desaturase [Firmicutes bacterium ADurb.Bin193]